MVLSFDVYVNSQISGKILELITLMNRDWMRVAMAGRQIPYFFIESTVAVDLPSSLVFRIQSAEHLTAKHLSTLLHLPS